MTDRNTLKSMLNALINDKPEEEASLDLHNYINDKMKAVSGIGQQEPVVEKPSEE